MADGFGVRVTGDEEFERKLAQLELQLEDLRGFWPMLVLIVHGWMGDMFKTSSSAG